MSENTVDTGYGPPDLDAPETGDVNEGSLLADLRAEAQKKVRKDDLTLRVPARPTMQLVFDVNIENATVNHWRKSATTKRGKKESFDLVKFSMIILAATATELIYKDKPTSLTLHDRELWDMFAAPSYFACIKAMYGSDADIIRAGTDVMTAAGYAESDEEEDDDYDDPTMTS